MKQRLLVTIFSTCLTAGFGIYAQEPAPPQSAPPQQSAQPNEQGAPETMTLVGCLTKGSADHTYTIADQKSGQKMNFSASERIESFLNQTVQLTGRMMSRGSESTFVPQTAKTVSTSCEGGSKP